MKNLEIKINYDQEHRATMLAEITSDKGKKYTFRRSTRKLTFDEFKDILTDYMLKECFKNIKEVAND